MTAETGPDRAYSATGAPCPGPAAPFAIAPDDATRIRLLEWHAAYGDFFRVPATGADAPESWVVNDPALVQQILVRRASHYTKGMGLDRVKILLGNGLMVSEGDFWARQRQQPFCSADRGKRARPALRGALLSPTHDCRPDH